MISENKLQRECVFLVFVIVATAVSDARHCTHVHPKQPEVIRGVHIEPAHIVKKRSIDLPLRILLYYDESMYRLDAEKYEIINNTVLPQVIGFWEKALMVRKTNGVLRLNRKCKNNEVFYKPTDPYAYCKAACEQRTMCGEVEVPEDHLESCRTCNSTREDCNMTEHSRSKGIEDADFVFYVSAIETERCRKGKTVAYAAHCQQEAALDRPIAGYANLCPNSISTRPQESELLVYKLKHELLHALGFSASLYAFYRDQDGNPLSPRTESDRPHVNEKLQAGKWSENVIRRVVRSDWLVKGGSRVEREVLMMVTPRVVEEVRKHFNCPELEGAELEDQGGDGTAITHWEKRIFENEAMTGTYTQRPVYSRITLAMMEDTGWYKANYSMAEPLTWGKDMGCDFVMKSCKEWMDSRKASTKTIYPFCDKIKKDPLETVCTIDRSAVALCNLVQHDNKLPLMYQNFDNLGNITPGTEDLYGGSVILADYCPYIQEFSWRSKGVFVRESNCRYTENNPTTEKNFALESYGPDSRCFDNTGLLWEQRSCKQVRQWRHSGSGCYPYVCADGLLHIMVSKYTFTCYHQGQLLDISIIANGWLHKGSLICPPCEEICAQSPEPFLCNNDSSLNLDSYPASSRDELHCDT